MILATGVQKEAVAHEARQLGGSGGMPPPKEKFWISDFLRSFLVQSESNHDRGIHLK